MVKFYRSCISEMCLIVEAYRALLARFIFHRNPKLRVTIKRENIENLSIALEALDIRVTAAAKTGVMRDQTSIAVVVHVALSTAKDSLGVSSDQRLHIVRVFTHRMTGEALLIPDGLKRLKMATLTIGFNQTMAA